MQLLVHLDSPPSRHISVGVRSAYFKCIDRAANRCLIFGAVVEPLLRVAEPVLPLDHRVMDKNVLEEPQQQVMLVAKDRSLSSPRTFGKRSTASRPSNSTGLLPKCNPLRKNPSPARKFMKDTAGPSCGIRGRTASVCSQEEAVALLLALAAVSEYRLLPQRPLRRRERRLLLGAVLAPSRFLPARHCSTIIPCRVLFFFLCFERVDSK